MAFGSADVKRFGGLRVIPDPADVGLEAAIDILNVDIADDRSHIKTRPGLALFGSANALSGTNGLAALVREDAQLLLVVSGGGANTYLEIFSTVGSASTGSWVGVAGTSVDMVNYGTPTTTVTFIATAAGVTLRKLTGAALATSVGSPKHLGVSPTSNRLIQGHFSTAAGSPTGANGSRSTVFFSDPGLPETFGANNYVHLRPGDGEEIRGIATWRGQTFVFKESKAYIFYGESTDATGAPVFEYRTIDIEGPCVAAYGPIAATSDNGVYFVTSRGVFVTTGGPPRRISDPIQPLFERDPNVATTVVPDRISVVGKRVFVDDNFYRYVYNETNGQWTMWTSRIGAPTGPVVGWHKDNAASTMWLIGRSVYDQKQFTASVDNAMVVDSHYQSGFSDLGSPAVKTVRQSQVWGTGNIVYAMATDYATADAGTALILGTAPARSDELERRARRGTLFAYKAAAAGGSWEIDEISMHLRAPRRVGARP